MPWETIFLTATLTGLAAGGLASLVGAHQQASVAWAFTAVLGAAAAAWWVVEGLWHRRFGVDVIALLALCGALIVHEELAGAVISVMVATGRTLEAWAAGHARRELRTLLERAPHQANRYGVDGLETVALDVLVPGDLILVRAGEVVPVDGTVVGPTAVTDESALTGEPLPVEHPRWGPGPKRRRQRRRRLRSPPHHERGREHLRRDLAPGRGVGAVDAAVRPNGRSLRGRFLVVTLAAAALAWAVSGELARAVAVLVVATPCPLDPGRAGGVRLRPVPCCQARGHRQGWGDA